MLLNTAIHYWIFLLSIVSSSWIKYPIKISSFPGWHKEPTDIKEAQNVCDKDSEINNDLYCYPQCFNKEDDQPKLDRCCFNENGRVLYVSPCTVEPENEATTTEVAADQTETLPAADSTSAATSTVTADLEKYPQCFNKEDGQPKESIAALMTMIEYYTQSHAMPRLKIWLRQQMMLLSKQHLWLRQT